MIPVTFVYVELCVRFGYVCVSVYYGGAYDLKTIVGDAKALNLEFNDRCDRDWDFPLIFILLLYVANKNTTKKKTEFSSTRNGLMEMSAVKEL
jgi:hypothetical protein